MSRILGAVSKYTKKFSCLVLSGKMDKRMVARRDLLKHCMTDSNLRLKETAYKLNHDYQSKKKGIE